MSYSEKEYQVAKILTNLSDTDITIGYVNSIGNGWGSIEQNGVTTHRFDKLRTGKLLVDSSNISQMEKYYKILDTTNYFINYQPKIADKISGLEGMVIDGIYKKTGSKILVNKWTQEDNIRYCLEINVKRVDTNPHFKMKVYSNKTTCYKWGESVAPSNWTGTKNVAFRGGVGRIKKENFRHKFIKDFMIKYKLI